ncbi:MAG: DUF1573 domain-containing protein [Tannerellaceae bacterium]|nr:DUF1573 domain-containing protein [Tannerellaceae bacterium]
MNLRNTALILVVLSAFICKMHAQEGALIHADVKSFDFGNIIETDGPVSHEFIIKNEGNAPLVLTRVTASCGCTTPEWTQAPIEAGKTGKLKVTYDPKGRPGPFRKTVSVFSNGNRGTLNMVVMGNVVAKPPTPAVSYPYSIGELKLSSKKVNYNSIRQDEALGEKISIKNEGLETVVIKKGKAPSYITVEVHPEVLQAGEAGEITFLYDAAAAKKMGRVYNEVPFSLEWLNKKHVNADIEIMANIIDRTGKLSASEKENAPSAQFSSTHLDFGVLEQKSGFLPGIAGSIAGIAGGGKSAETLTITNTGKTTLSIYSVTCDNDIVDISGGRKELKPGASAVYKISIRPKSVKAKLNTNIHVVTNDPNGPVRLIKVTAEK